MARRRIGRGAEPQEAGGPRAVACGVAISRSARAGGSTVGREWPGAALSGGLDASSGVGSTVGRGWSGAALGGGLDASSGVGSTAGRGWSGAALGGGLDASSGVGLRISRHRDHLFRGIVTTCFAIVTTCFAIVTTLFAGV